MRSHVSIVQVRVSEIQAGDVVNRRGAERTGWIEVARLEQLQGGSYVVHDESDRDSFTATAYDLVWLQVLVVLPGNSHIPVDL